MKRHGAISLGDLAIAVKTLNPATTEQAERIAACLGFSLIPKVDRPGPQHRILDRRKSTHAQPTVDEHPAEGMQEAFVLPPRVFLPPRPEPPADTSRVFETFSEELDETADGEPVPTEVLEAAPIADLQDNLTKSFGRLPLIPHRRQRAVLSAAVATRTAEGEVDLEPMIRRIVHRRHVSALARQPTPTLRHGVQLLLDRSESMAPYLADLEDLRLALEKTVGRHRVWSTSFSGAPLKPCLAAAGRHRSVKLRRGIPVVVATDFGIGAPLSTRPAATEADWLALAAAARRLSCPIVALTPHPSVYWKDSIARCYTLIPWDPMTTAGDIRRVLGPGHEAPR